MPLKLFCTQLGVIQFGLEKYKLTRSMITVNCLVLPVGDLLVSAVIKLNNTGTIAKVLSMISIIIVVIKSRM